MSHYLPDDSYQYLDKTILKLQNEFHTAKPFKHVVLDGLFDKTLLSHCYTEFPKPSHRWWKYDNALEKKLAFNTLHEMPKCIRELICELQSNRFVSFLERVTQVQGLIVDHTLNGGGLHQILRGGKLDIHADYNFHPITRLDRRLNTLLYLNPQWLPLYRGQLELWRADMNECQASIEPIFNRLVIFETNDTAYHGHPDPLECPEWETRKSIALYYYSNGRPEHERSYPHSTLFKKRPQDPQDDGLDELREIRSRRRLT